MLGRGSCCLSNRIQLKSPNSVEYIYIYIISRCIVLDDGIGESRDDILRHSICFLLQSVGLQHLKGTQIIVLIYKNQTTFYRQLLKLSSLLILYQEASPLLV